MSRCCSHGNIWGRCPEEVMGYVPPQVPLRLNLDRAGMPKDYATYMWVTYQMVVADNSSTRRAFLHHGRPVLRPSQDTR